MPFGPPGLGPSLFTGVNNYLSAGKITIMVDLYCHDYPLNDLQLFLSGLSLILGSSLRQFT